MEYTHIYIYTHEQSENSPTKIKYSRFIWQTKEIKNYIYQLGTKLLDSVGEGEGGMIWENGIETCIISYKKLIASLGSVQDTGCLGLVH